MASRKLFREYIGANWNGVSFSDVPINDNVDFHFILSFAVDYTKSTPHLPANGVFTPYWDTENLLSLRKIAAVKKKHPNVKVALSIGCATLGVGAKQVEVFFKPHDTDSWVSNAVSSLTKIIRDYHLDGIDIDYRKFVTDIDIDIDIDIEKQKFADCMGSLIQTLKTNGVIQFASIAPNGGTSEFYEKLWEDHNGHIDYVNYKFYELHVVDRYLAVYEAQRVTFGQEKLLASLSTEDNRMPETAIEACTELQEQGKLNGIFIWSADDSTAGGFAYEIRAQNLLANPPN